MYSHHARTVATAAVLMTVSVAAAASMNCGADVGLCGVLTLESGYGSGTYSVRGVMMPINVCLCVCARA